MYKNLFYFILFIFTITLFVNCEQEPDYGSLIQQGINSGIENNELFLEYKLGMTRDDFFKISWQMNKDEKITGLVKIDYEMEDLKSRAIMRFYPDFVNDRISKMPADVHYVGWAPWNQELSSDSLVVDLVEYYGDKLNTSFKKLFVPDLNKDAYVSVDGNRAITVYPLTEMVARVDFTDLNALQNP
jgi:hypothetical protein